MVATKFQIGDPAKLAMDMFAAMQDRLAQDAIDGVLDPFASGVAAGEAIAAGFTFAAQGGRPVAKVPRKG